MAVLSRSLKAYKRLRRSPNAAAALFDGRQQPEDSKKVDRVVRQDSSRAEVHFRP